MRHIYLISLLILASLSSSAQRQAEFTLSAGPTHYFGDLGNETFPLSSTRFGWAVGVRNYTHNPARKGILNPAFMLEHRLSFHRIGYDEVQPINKKTGFDLKNYGRGLNFRNDIWGFSTHLVFTHYSQKYQPTYRDGNRWAYFGYIGIGIYHARPKADLFRGDMAIENRYYHWNDGTLRDAAESTGSGNVVERDGVYEADLRQWITERHELFSESQAKPKYGYWHLGFPVGLGIRYGINKNITVSAEVSVYNFNTDFLDDVSDSYATYEEIKQRYPNDLVKQELAIYISDPSGKGTNGAPGPATSQRGNPNKNDLFSYVGFEIAYKFTGRMPNIYLGKKN